MSRLRLPPIVVDYGRPPEGVSAKRVFSKTASVFTALAAICFTVLGMFAILATCLSGGAGGVMIWLVAVGFFALAGGGLFATACLSEMAKPRPDVDAVS